MTIYCQLGGSQDVLCDFNLFIYNKLSNVKKAYFFSSKGGKESVMGLTGILKDPSQKL